MSVVSVVGGGGEGGCGRCRWSVAGGRWWVSPVGRRLCEGPGVISPGKRRISPPGESRGHTAITIDIRRPHEASPSPSQRGSSLSPLHRAAREGLILAGSGAVIVVAFAATATDLDGGGRQEDRCCIGLDWVRGRVHPVNLGDTPIRIQYTPHCRAGAYVDTLRFGGGGGGEGKERRKRWIARGPVSRCLRLRLRPSVSALVSECGRLAGAPVSRLQLSLHLEAPAPAHTPLRILCHARHRNRPPLDRNRHHHLQHSTAVIYSRRKGRAGSGGPKREFRISRTWDDMMQPYIMSWR